MHLEDELRKALRAEDPGAAFTQRVLARARDQRAGRDVAMAHGQEPSAAPVAGATDAIGATGTKRAHAAPRPVRTTRWVAAAVAASLALGAAGVQWVQHRRYVAEGERARAQVLAALRITSDKLNLVHDRITEPAEAR